MNKNIENSLDAFNEDENQKANNENVKNEKKVILDEREGLIERVDKVLVTKDGRQLIREQY